MSEWNDKLISRERARAISADSPVRGAVREGILFLDCGDCGQAVTMLQPRGAALGYLMTPDGIASAVLRHLVSHHDQSLSGGTDGRGRGPAEDGEAVHGADPADHRGGGGHPGDRPVHQEAGSGRGHVAEGGDVR